MRAPPLLEQLAPFLISDLANIVGEVASTHTRRALKDNIAWNAELTVLLCARAGYAVQYLLGPNTLRRELSEDEQQLLLNPLKLPQLDLTPLQLSAGSAVEQQSAAAGIRAAAQDKGDAGRSGRHGVGRISCHARSSVPQQRSSLSHPL